MWDQKSLNYGVRSQAFCDVVSIALRLAPTRDDSFSRLESLTLIALSCDPKFSPAGQQTAKLDRLYPNASAAPLILSCTCAMHGFAMAGAAPREKRSNQNYKDEHLGSWPVYVRRCGPADWLVSKQRAPSHEQNLSCMQSTNGHAKTQ